MSGPSAVSVKRSWDELAPDTLIVEHRTKRGRIETAYSATTYVRQRHSAEELGEASAKDVRPTVLLSPEHEDINGRRTFRLARPASGRKQPATKNHPVSVVNEASGRALLLAALSNVDPQGSPEAAEQPDSRVLKRPGKGSSNLHHSKLSGSQDVTRNLTPEAELAAVAADLHRFALDELANRPKPKVSATPRLSGSRSREIHRQRTSLLDEPKGDVDMARENDGDYMYDTYVLAVPESLPAINPGSGDQGEKVGYLVIHEEDQETWDAYLDEDSNNKNSDTDDEDENAENHYDADYPDDELASDDEFNRNAYGFRGKRASDDEEWDEQTGAYSDDEKDTADMLRQKKPRQFARWVASAK